MPISSEEVKYVAHLARVKLTDKEIKVFAGQLEAILEFIDKLKKLNTNDVLPLSHILPLKNVFRQDQVKMSLNTNDVLKNAPEKEGDFFKVPKVIE